MGHPRLTAAIVALLASLSLAQTQPTTQPTGQPFPVTIDVELNQPIGPWKPVHRFFGCDEPNYAYMPAGKRLLKELGKLGTPDAPVYFRSHNLMTTGDGTPALKWGSTNLYTEDAAGNPVYDFTIVDKIFDAYLDAGVRPYVQLGFMPEAMSTKPQPYRHYWDPKQPYDAIYTGWAYPPKDYKKWEELCFVWAKHCLERYGQAEVERWYWQTWNEANIGYWKGTPEEFQRLHDHAVNGVRRAIPNARVGGPDTAGAGGRFMDAFLKHVLDETNFATQTKGTPTDFVSFHSKGSPINTKENFVRMGITSQLRECQNAFIRFAKDPRTKNLPIVVGEFDPEGCAACQGANLAYRNGTMYSSYTAISFARTLELADRHGVNLEGLLTWAFLFEDQSAFAGFRVLASGEIDHPVLNTFRMMAQMRGERVRVTSSATMPLDEIVANGVRGKPEVGALATTAAGRTSIMVWHYHDDDLPGDDADVTLTLHAPTPDLAHVRYSEQRIDQTHSNAFTAWKAMGSPPQPTPEQVEQLQRAGQLATIDANHAITPEGNKVAVKVRLPRQGVSLITVEWDAR